MNADGTPFWFACRTRSNRIVHNVCKEGTHVDRRKRNVLPHIKARLKFDARPFARICFRAHKSVNCMIRAPLACRGFQNLGSTSDAISHLLPLHEC